MLVDIEDDNFSLHGMSKRVDFNSFWLLTESDNSLQLFLEIGLISNERGERFFLSRQVLIVHGFKISYHKLVKILHLVEKSL